MRGRWWTHGYAAIIGGIVCTNLLAFQARSTGKIPGTGFLLSLTCIASASDFTYLPRRAVVAG
ncbi:hypothetical protein BDV40DRAFT_282361 [Aspergillus tamarii]|uniref:Uncharacterized protein n=1 Tax=Aspergillus tamarii TaxID=41984 RepID=A0A5N6UBP6_ASPTM|nr:hypothetical protein BDV40DRAFT_282361 [Aspergillus tamarii]